MTHVARPVAFVETEVESNVPKTQSVQSWLNGFCGALEASLSPFSNFLKASAMSHAAGEDGGDSVLVKRFRSKRKAISSCEMARSGSCSLLEEENLGAGSRASRDGDRA